MNLHVYADSKEMMQIFECCYILFFQGFVDILFSILVIIISINTGQKNTRLSILDLIMMPNASFHSICFQMSLADVTYSLFTLLYVIEKDLHLRKTHYGKRK